MDVAGIALLTVTCIAILVTVLYLQIKGYKEEEDENDPNVTESTPAGTTEEQPHAVVSDESNAEEEGEETNTSIEETEEELREQIKREVLSEMKVGENTDSKRSPVLAIVACSLLGAFILGQLGGTLELTGGKFDFGVIGYTIGALSFAIAALALMIVDTVKRMR